MGANTYVAVGNKLDISDLISNISPSDTPVYSLIGKASATATYHEWLEDSLPSAAANKQVEGFTYTTATPGTRTRLGNYTQIFTRGYAVTDTQEVVQKHGVKSELAYQMQKAMKAIAFDVEKALIEQATKAAGAADTARQFGGLPYWITTNVEANGGTARVITEKVIVDALQHAWNQGGTPGVLICSGGNKRNISALTDSATKYIKEEDTTLGRTVEVFESDFGRVKILMDRFMPDTQMFVVDPSLWKVAMLRPFKTIDLPKTGDNEGKVIVGELTLEARSQAANALIKDLKLA